jgi:hypothetical protein
MCGVAGIAGAALLIVIVSESASVTLGAVFAAATAAAGAVFEGAGSAPATIPPLDPTPSVSAPRGDEVLARAVVACGFSIGRVVAISVIA